jgi:Zn finger protein HypA/HybF involved in hydrogenase expression
VARPAFQVAEIFRRHGAAYREANAGHLDRCQLRVMAAIEACRTAALGGHVRQCKKCGHKEIAYGSCRDRHCPTCQGSAARAWLEARQADLLPVEYFHVVFTVPQPIAAVAFQNKAVVYGILFEAAAETLKTIARDPQHLGAEIGFTTVLHTWGQTLTHHPHVHCIVPGGGLSADGRSWIPCRPGYFLPERVLSTLFRGVFLGKLVAAHKDGRLQFFSDLVDLAELKAFSRYLAPLWRLDWVVDSKQPFAGPEQVLRYLSRYTHRVAISDHRLVDVTDDHVTFTWKDYRHEASVALMTLSPAEFMRRFLLHVLPDGFQRVRHYGFLANATRQAKLARIRQLLTPAPQLQGVPVTQDTVTATIAAEDPAASVTEDEWQPTCPECGGEMQIVETLPKARRNGVPRIDTS